MENVIWIADDDYEDLSFYEEAFQKIDSSINIVTFLDGNAVLDQLALNNQSVPRLLIVDGYLPGLAGVPLIQQLKTGNFPEFPIVMITGTLLPVEKLKITIHGIEVFQKLASLNELHHLLISILSKIPYSV